MFDELRGAVKRILQQSQAPKSLPQIRKELAGSFHISSKDLGALLDEMTTIGEIFSWPQKKFWDRDPRTVLPDLILTFMAKSQVATASKIKTNLKLPLEMVQTALNELVDGGRLHLWQPGKAPYFCLSEPRKTALETILTALAAGPLTEKELIAWVRKRLPGYQGNDLNEHLSYSKQVYEYPKYGKIKTKYGLKPPEPGPYLVKAIQEIATVQRLLAPFQISREAIHDALGRELGLEPKTRGLAKDQSKAETAPHEAEALLLKTMTRLQPPGQRRALVSIRELRRSVELAKSVFDHIVLSLAIQGRVALHHHDFPSSLSPNERDELVRDEQGTYYVGIVPKETP
ncbi:MAG: hypothetical protein EHM26_01310 [Desulfobacteraceae bacterium]|nr:MAG: hypothetical protein EHM26_01310 [Desulfobacteraceae bacterium]